MTQWGDLFSNSLIKDNFVDVIDTKKKLSHQKGRLKLCMYNTPHKHTCLIHCLIGLGNIHVLIHPSTPTDDSTGALVRCSRWYISTEGKWSWCQLTKSWLERRKIWYCWVERPSKSSEPEKQLSRNFKVLKAAGREHSDKHRLMSSLITFSTTTLDIYSRNGNATMDGRWIPPKTARSCAKPVPVRPFSLTRKSFSGCATEGTNQHSISGPGRLQSDQPWVFEYSGRENYSGYLGGCASKRQRQSIQYRMCRKTTRHPHLDQLSVAWYRVRLVPAWTRCRVDLHSKWQPSLKVTSQWNIQIPCTYGHVEEARVKRPEDGAGVSLCGWPPDCWQPDEETFRRRHALATLWGWSHCSSSIQLVTPLTTQTVTPSDIATLAVNQKLCGLSCSSNFRWLVDDFVDATVPPVGVVSAVAWRNDGNLKGS